MVSLSTGFHNVPSVLLLLFFYLAFPKYSYSSPPTSEARASGRWANLDRPRVMSGRGIPGGGLVRQHKPEDVKVSLGLRTTTSAPIFSLTPPAPNAGNRPADSPPSPFYIEIHAFVKFSTHPTLPVTLATRRTPLERRRKSLPRNSSQEQELGKGEVEKAAALTSPAWLHSALTPLRSTTHPSKLAGPPALGYIAHERGGFTRDLRDSWDFITIPPAGEGKEKAEVVVKHLSPRGNLRFYSKTGGEGEMKPEKGEKFVVGPSAGSLGTFWWKWGDLGGDLADKKFRADEWWDGNGGEDGSQVLLGEREEWVQSEGENGFGLTMKVENKAKIEFI